MERARACASRWPRCTAGSNPVARAAVMPRGESSTAMQSLGARPAPSINAERALQQTARSGRCVHCGREFRQSAAAGRELRDLFDDRKRRGLSSIATDRGRNQESCITCFSRRARSLPQARLRATRFCIGPRPRRALARAWRAPSRCPVGGGRWCARPLDGSSLRYRARMVCRGHPGRSSARIAFRARSGAGLLPRLSRRLRERRSREPARG